MPRMSKTTTAPHGAPLPEPRRRSVAPSPSFRLHRGAGPDATPATVPPGNWPLHSVDVVASSLVVASVAAGWIVTAAVLTAPALAVGGWLARAFAGSEGA
jgi:hypothetical protein